MVSELPEWRLCDLGGGLFGIDVSEKYLEISVNRLEKMAKNAKEH